MELIGIDNSRLTSLFVTSRPEGQIFVPAILPKFVARYKFLEHPSSAADLGKDQFHFANGSFKDVRIQTFDVYNDGVIITAAANTSFHEALLDDVCSWLASFGVERVETNLINMSYESQILIKANPAIFKCLFALAPIQEQISKALQDATGLTVDFHPVGLAIAPDNAKVAGMKPSTFRVERRPGSEFELDYYVSSAPLRTDDHIRILENLETLLG